MTQTFSLFNRHELPTNEGAICEKFNFDKFEVEKSELWDKALSAKDCELIVTGLTPALTQFISEWVKINSFVGQDWYSGEPYGFVETNRLCLLHYNNQVIFGRILSDNDLQEMQDEQSREDFYRA